MQDSLENSPIEEKKFLCQLLINIKKEPSEERSLNKALLIRLLTLKINQSDQFKEIVGGYSNNTYHYEHENLVLRFPKRHNPRYRYASDASDASVEIHNLSQAKIINLTPLEVVAYDTKYALLVTQFISSYQFCSEAYFKDKDKLTALADLIKKLHYSNVTFKENKEAPFPFIRASSKIFTSIRSILTVQDYEILQKLDAIRNSVAQFKIIPRPSHGDLHHSNLIDINGVIQLIDWEFSSLRDPAYDISRFLSSADLSPEAEDFFLHLYKNSFNITLPDDKFAHLKIRIQLFKPLIYFSIVVWAKYTISFYADKKNLFEAAIKNFTEKTLHALEKIDLPSINAKDYGANNTKTYLSSGLFLFRITSESENEPTLVSAKHTASDSR